MGYSHYWNAEPANQNTAKAIAFCNIILIAKRSLVGTFSGEVPTCPEGLASGLELFPRALAFNGIGADSHESFNLYPDEELELGYSFCKTNGKPYDLLVTACLTVLAHYGAVTDVSSDGGAEGFTAGAALANEVLAWTGTTFLNPLSHKVSSAVREKSVQH